MVELNGTLLVQFINFFVLVLILGKFAYGPIMRVLQERREKIAGDLAAAAKAKEDAEEALATYKQRILDARREADQIIEQAKKQRDKEAEEAKKMLRAELAREKEQARLDIAQERDKALRDVKEDVVTLSIAIASKVIEKNMDDGANQALVQQIIAKLDKQSIGQ